MNISLCSDSDVDDWREFVTAQEDCCHYHRHGWQEVIKRAYGHQCFYLLAKDKGQPTGILPLVLVKSRLFGRSLTSLPFLDFAGLVATDPESRHGLLDKATELCLAHRVDYLELRQTKPIGDDFTTDTHKVSLTLELKPNEEQLWKALSSERRNRIRKARKAHLSVEFAGEAALPVFYRIWAENMRDLGSPAHSYAFFDQILRVFSSSARVILVKHHTVPVGAAICLYAKGVLTLPWVSSLRKYFSLYPNNILYWEAMLFAIEQSCRLFDFGRSSKDSGTYVFKTRWGAVPQTLHWQFKVFHDKEPGRPATEGPKYRWATGVWKRMPVGLTKLIGPLVRKNITA